MSLSSSRFRCTLLLVMTTAIVVFSATAALAEPQRHTVRSGETLGGIALRHGISVRELCAANRLSEDRPLQIGRELIVPEKKASRKAPKPPSGKQYVVRQGDTLGGIARKFGVSTSALAEANGIANARGMRSGQTLVIPKKDGSVGAREHEVVSGETLGGLARRYGLGIEELARANRMRRTDPIKIGQMLLIPGSNGEVPSSERAEAASSAPEQPGGMQSLPVPGALPAYYYEPTGPGRLSLRPVLMYLHGRGAVPAEYCRRWAKVVRHLGWLVCPQGPFDHGGGRRGWGNNWAQGRGIVKKTLDALRAKYGRRVQLYGNTIMGFSEGAFVAMNVGLYEPRAFNRWLILGADTDYWSARELAALDRNRGRIRRVYLITGQKDVVFGETKKVRRWLRGAGIPVRVSTPKDLGHAVALESKPAMYKAALRWLGG